MKSFAGKLREALVHGHFSLLLITLLGMFFLLPLIPSDLRILERMMSGFSILVLLSCMRAVVQKKSMLVFIILLGVLNIIFSGIEAVGPLGNQSLIIVELGVRLLYYLLVLFSILRKVLDKSPVTTDKICGALSAYLLIGMIWALIYAMFQIVEPNSFSVPEGMQTERAMAFWALYFSFVSLTTIGYGDITPLTPAAQTYAFLEAVFGQIFLTVLVARLVALHIVHQGRRNNDEE